MNLVNLTINNKSVSVPKGSTILDAAKKLNIKIPTLCHLNMSEVNIVNNVHLVVYVWLALVKD